MITAHFVLSYASTETPPHTVGHNFNPVISQLCSSSTAILGFFSYLAPAILSHLSLKGPFKTLFTIET